MINLDDISELKEVCNKLSSGNLQYVKAVANAIKFTENTAKSISKTKAEPKKSKQNIIFTLKWFKMH